jgi:hypothetical protein
MPTLAFDAAEIDAETARQLVDAGLYEYRPQRFGSRTLGTIRPNAAASALLLAPAAAFYRATPGTWRQIQTGPTWGSEER